MNIENIDTLTKFKTKVIKKLRESPYLLDLIFDVENVCAQDADMENHIFPYEYVPDSAAAPASFIGIEADIPKIINSTVKDVYVYIYISVHKSLMTNIKFRSGTRTDLLAYEVDKIMNGNLDFGIGKAELFSIERCKPEQVFYGRVLVYKMKEFNRKQGGY